MKSVEEDVLEYHFEGFVLTLHETTFLIEVRLVKGDPVYPDRVADLPEWVFHPDALWVRQGPGPIEDRVRDAEKIKEHLLLNQSLHKGTVRSQRQSQVQEQ